MTYYAWSNFRKKVNEMGQVEEWIVCGDEITQDDIGVSDIDWNDYIANGVIRKEPYPPVPTNVPPVEYFNVDEDKKALLEAAAEANPSTGPGLNAPEQTTNEPPKTPTPPASGTTPPAGTGDK